MIDPSKNPLKTLDRSVIQARLESMLTLFSVYAVPIAGAIISIIAMIAWERTYQKKVPVELPIYALFDHAEAMDTRSALAQITSSQPVARFNTNLSKAPVWLMISPVIAVTEPVVVELPSRHAISIKCWEVGTDAYLGQADRSQSHLNGRITASRAGFSFGWNPGMGNVLCRTTYAGPAQVTALLWDPSDFRSVTSHFHRLAGLLRASMLVLACFVLIMAVVNRQQLYLLFAAWLVLSMRMAEISSGWDFQWLGHTIPIQMLLPSRALTISLFAITSVWMYHTMFRRELANSSAALLNIAALLFGVPLLALALLLPYNQFLPIFWAASLIYGVVMLNGLWRVRVFHGLAGRILIGAFASIFLTGFIELVCAALGFHRVIEYINSLTGAIASSVLVAFAVAEQIRVETVARVAAQSRVEQAFDAIPVGIFALNEEGLFLTCNRALHEMLSIGPGATPSWAEHFGLACWTKLATQSRLGQVDFDVQHVDGVRSFSIRATMVNGQIEGSIKEITDRLQAIEQLRFLADNDPLTRALNRHGIEQAYASAMLRQRGGLPVSLVYLNLDRFKAINDMFGHEAGDEVLRQTCELARKLLADHHSICRMGGDEFVIVMPDTDVRVANVICQSLGELLAKANFPLASGSINVRVSIGVVEVRTGATFHESAALAWSACRQSDSRYGTDVVIYERDSNEMEVAQMELDLAALVSSSDLSSVLCLSVRKITSASKTAVERLMLAEIRLRGGAVAATSSEIVAAARKTGNAGAVDRWQLAAALSLIESRPACDEGGMVLISLSGASLNDAQFLSDALMMLSGRRNAARWLCLELAEGAAFADPTHTIEVVRRIRGTGARVGLNEYGSGHAVLAAMHLISVDVLRFDAALVLRASEHPKGAAVMDSLVSLAAGINIPTVAEPSPGVFGAEALMLDLNVDYLVSSSEPSETPFIEA